jgi:hypothetical protein
MNEQVDREACRRECMALWDMYGLWTMLNALADVIHADTRLVETYGQFPEEVERKDALVCALRNGAGQLEL